MFLETTDPSACADAEPGHESAWETFGICGKAAQKNAQSHFEVLETIQNTVLLEKEMVDHLRAELAQSKVLLSRLKNPSHPRSHSSTEAEPEANSEEGPCLTLCGRSSSEASHEFHMNGGFLQIDVAGVLQKSMQDQSRSPSFSHQAETHWSEITVRAIVTSPGSKHDPSSWDLETIAELINSAATDDRLSSQIATIVAANTVETCLLSSSTGCPQHPSKTIRFDLRKHDSSALVLLLAARLPSEKLPLTTPPCLIGTPTQPTSVFWMWIHLRLLRNPLQALSLPPLLPLQRLVNRQFERCNSQQPTCSPTSPQIRSYLAAQINFTKLYPLQALNDAVASKSHLASLISDPTLLLRRSLRNKPRQTSTNRSRSHIIIDPKRLRLMVDTAIGPSTPMSETRCPKCHHKLYP